MKSFFMWFIFNKTEGSSFLNYGSILNILDQSFWTAWQS